MLLMSLLCGLLIYYFDRKWQKEVWYQLSNGQRRTRIIYSITYFFIFLYNAIAYISGQTFLIYIYMAIVYFSMFFAISLYLNKFISLILKR